ncbi:MAG: sugar phosphate isomerase/epimerase family protein [Candidatus Latescibacteria bacterium]|nr:sugar phosphate isomerase/epimerase family protein [Candidatus Latescibacterota bacterium]
MFKSLSPGTIGVKASLPEALAYAKIGGFQGVDVGIQDLAKRVEEDGADAVRQLFDEAGMRIGSWGLPVAWDGPQADYERDLAGLPALASAGASVGALRVARWIPAGSKERRFRENFRWHVERLRPICEVLKDHGCSLGLEFIGPQTKRIDEPYGFIYTLPGMLALCEAIGTGNAGLLLDCWHWHTGLGTLSDLRCLVADDVIHVHVNDAPAGVDLVDQIDNVRALPSETGVIDLVGFLKVLDEVEYGGPVTPEPFSQRVRELPAEQAVRETGEGLDKAWKAAGLS